MKKNQNSFHQLSLFSRLCLAAAMVFGGYVVCSVMGQMPETRVPSAIAMFFVVCSALSMIRKGG